MREYIVNLTNNLIGENCLDDLLRVVHSRKRFIERVSIALEVNEFAKMNDETIGRIMGSLETCDVPASKKELLFDLRFTGDCGDLLRELASRCLTHAIYGRLVPDELREFDVPAYHRNKKEGRSEKS